MGEKFFRLRLFDDIISELSNAVLKTRPLLREVNDVLISYPGSRMRSWNSRSRVFLITLLNPQHQICIMALRLSDYISIFGLVFFFVMRDNGIVKNFTFCPLSLGFMVEF